jgi:hypothetical protein
MTLDLLTVRTRGRRRMRRAVTAESTGRPRGAAGKTGLSGHWRTAFRLEQVTRGIQENFDRTDGRGTLPVADRGQGGGHRHRHRNAVAHPSAGAAAPWWWSRLCRTGLTENKPSVKISRAKPAASARRRGREDKVWRPGPMESPLQSREAGIRQEGMGAGRGGSPARVPEGRPQAQVNGPPVAAPQCSSSTDDSSKVMTRNGHRGSSTALRIP